ncbi:unnamed protein product [Sphagnum compactum]
MKLVGHCDEDDVLLLMLQYMPNGTLYDHLHDDRHSNSGAISSWHLRVKIALEAARGIEYLHTYAVPAVIHRDIKSSNILLHASWTACVSDFGLSLLGPEEEVSHISMAAAVPIPQGLELQAVSILASVAEHRVRQEGKERPSMIYIVTRSEQAFSFSCNNRRKLQPAPQESSDQYNNNNAAANSSIANWIQSLATRPRKNILHLATSWWCSAPCLFEDS